MLLVIIFGSVLIMKRIKKKLIVFICIVLSLALICCICVGAFLFLDYYFNKKLTLIYTDETANGYSIKIYERGRSLLAGKHYLTIEIDSEEIIKITMINNANIYPEEHIVCDLDDSEEYQLTFKDHTDTNGSKLIFDSNFTTIRYIRCYELEIINDSVTANDETIFIYG